MIEKIPLYSFVHLKKKGYNSVLVVINMVSEREMIKRRYGVAVAIFALLVLVVMAMIFYFSAETAVRSTETSNGVTRFVLKIFRPDFDRLSKSERSALFSKASHYVRKGAHFTEYFLLGLFSTLLVLSALKICGKQSLLFFLVPPLFSAIYAFFDEGHQRFVGGRAAQITDVLIDFSGALLATLIVFFICLAVRKKRSR